MCAIIRQHARQPAMTGQARPTLAQTQTLRTGQPGHAGSAGLDDGQHLTRAASASWLSPSGS